MSQHALKVKFAVILMLFFVAVILLGFGYLLRGSRLFSPKSGIRMMIAGAAAAVIDLLLLIFWSP
jgi:hypothetical protein